MKRSEMRDIIKRVWAGSGSWPVDEDVAEAILKAVEKAGMCPISENPDGSLLSLNWEPEDKICQECRGTGLPSRKHSDLSEICEDCSGTGYEK